MKTKFNLFILLLIVSYTIKSQCSANFNYTVGAGGNTYFTSTSIGTTTNTQYYWSGASGISFSNTYSLNIPYNGTYTITLSIVDSLVMPACYSSISKTLNVATAPCIGDALFTSYLSTGGLVWFNKTNNNTSPSDTYYWNFGDGTTLANGGPNTNHTYSSAGIYTVTSVITDPLGICSYTSNSTVTVSIMSCSLSAAFTYTLGSGGLVNFTSTSTNTSTTTQYFWSFGDGNGSTLVNPSNIYSSNGIYTVTLFIQDSVTFSCNSSVTQTLNYNTTCLANASFNLGHL